MPIASKQQKKPNNPSKKPSHSREYGKTTHLTKILLKTLHKIEEHDFYKR